MDYKQKIKFNIDNYVYNKAIYGFKERYRPAVEAYKLRQYTALSIGGIIDHIKAGVRRIKK